MTEKEKKKLGFIDTERFAYTEFYLDVVLRNFFRIIHMCGGGSPVEYKGIDEDYLDDLSHGRLKTEIEAFEWCAFFTLPFLLMAFVALFWLGMYIFQFRTILDFTILHYFGVAIISVLYSSIVLVSCFCLSFLGWMRIVHPRCIRKAHDRYIGLRNEKRKIEEAKLLHEERRRKQNLPKKMEYDEKFDVEFDDDEEEEEEEDNDFDEDFDSSDIAQRRRKR